MGRMMDMAKMRKHQPHTKEEEEWNDAEEKIHDNGDDKPYKNVEGTQRNV